jgi:hypothetical protein
MKISFSNQPIGAESTHRAGHGERELIWYYWGADVRRSFSTAHKEMRCPTVWLSRVALHVLACNWMRVRQIATASRWWRRLPYRVA